MTLETARRNLARLVLLALIGQFLLLGANTVRWQVIDPWGIVQASWNSMCVGTVRP